ncbi:septum formation protein Maf [Alteromonas sp. 5E99-2]|uniref:Maf family protein n=1 Tax=Alteromonas sp. 5E99-2 TaxID=2817683 RepID=UPI001A98D852|nr:nucleoside triphosphate pyrophosphatase [Alteromonas sp. 5E99-2]MBO1254956.1 septum formation protein Maf [Alteromonas sp. 5E99-2]
MTQLILASGSRYRHQRLIDANIQFSFKSPNIDETPIPNENGKSLAIRLATSKANAIANEYHNAVIMGSDQVAEVTTNEKIHILGKPKTKEKAVIQLNLCSGNSVSFYTALYLLCTQTNKEYVHLDTTVVDFRELTKEQIAQYLDIDQPFDCAGSFKMEKAGITLFNAIHNTDPNALIGMPMIGLTQGLESLNHSIFNFMPKPSSTNSD